jgi:hypothetical protein
VLIGIETTISLVFLLNRDKHRGSLDLSLAVTEKDQPKVDLFPNRDESRKTTPNASAFRNGASSRLMAEQVDLARRQPLWSCRIRRT